VFDRFDAHVPVAHVVVPAGGPSREVTVYKLTGFKGYAGVGVPAGDSATTAPGEPAAPPP
jgi:hypothetical protein